MKCPSVRLLLGVPALLSTGCPAALVTYIPPVATVGDITDAGDLDITVGPYYGTVAYGIVDHVNLRASGDYTPALTETDGETGEVVESIGGSAWDARLGVGYATGWGLGSKGTGRFVVGGSLDLGAGHIVDDITYAQFNSDAVINDCNCLTTDRAARLSMYSAQVVGQGTASLQWRPGGVGAGARVVGQALFDDGESVAIDSDSLGLGRVEPFFFGRAGYAPLYFTGQVGVSIQMEYQLYLNEAYALYATSSPVWAFVGLELQLDRLGSGKPFFHDPAEE